MRRRAQSILVWLAIAAPAASIAARAAFTDLGANPVETLEHATGEWAIRLLFATLAVTPLRQLTGWQGLARFRRRIGLAAFAYATAHFSCWALFDNGLDLGAIAADIAKRPWITVGFSAFVLLIPLAVTSTRGWIRRLGKRWTSLHRLVYVAAVLAVVHYWWLVKKDVRGPLVHAAILGLLLGARAIRSRRRTFATSETVCAP